MQKIKLLIKKLLSTGFFSVIGSNFLVKVISFCSGMFIVRLLTMSDFGLYSYINNFVSVIMILDGLGTIPGILQFCSENANNKQKMLQFEHYGFKVGMTFNGIVTIVLLFFGAFFKFQFEGANIIMLLSAIVPITQYFVNYTIIICRTRLLNNYYSRINIINGVMSLVSIILGALIMQINGVALFKIFGQFITIIIAIMITRNILFLKNTSGSLLPKEKKDFLKISLNSCVNNAIGQVMVLLDVFIIGIILPNTEIIAAYKTATMIPFALLFIPMSLVHYFFTYFARNNKDRAWVKSNTNKYVAGSAVLNLIISAVTYLLAPFIIEVVFGKQFSDSVTPFRVLIIFYFFNATFRIPYSQVLISQRKVAYNLTVSILSGVLNIVSNIFFILKFGSIGAAYSTLLIGVLTSITDAVYFYYIINRKLIPSRKGKTPFEIYELEQASAKLSEAPANGDNL